MICPNCFSIETEGSLTCRKCGAQLQTGIFQRPAAPASREDAPAGPQASTSARSWLVALAVLAVAVLVLVLVLSRLAVGMH